MTIGVRVWLKIGKSPSSWCRTEKGRHGLFFAHLALEKILKALICSRTHDVPPKRHNLTRLGELAGLKLSDQQADVPADMNQFNLEGRYPEFHMFQVSPQEAKEFMARSEEVLIWLTRQS